MICYHESPALMLVDELLNCLTFDCHSKGKVGNLLLSSTSFVASFFSLPSKFTLSPTY